MRGGEGLPLDADYEDELGLRDDIEVSFLLTEAGETDLLALGITVFLDVGLGALEDDAAFFLSGLDEEYFVSKVTLR